MRPRVILGAAAASALVGFGALTGSVISGAFAQAPTATNQAQVQAMATPAPGTTTPGNNGQGPRGMHGGPGNQGFGMRGGPRGGLGFGEQGLFPGKGFGASATADTANRVIERATNVISTTNGDLAYAKGKMDTTNIEKWLSDANSLVSDAKASVTATKYQQAGEYAEAASDLAGIAEQQMGQALGFDKLPSASQRPQRFNKGNPTQTTATVTQAQASRVLASTYHNLVMQGSLIKSGSGKAGSYLTDAQNEYKAAYDAYQAGKYNDAVSAARLAEQLAGVASDLNRAANDTTTGTDQPVTVPTPNF